MDTNKLNPWHWFEKEEGHPMPPATSPATQQAQQAQQGNTPAMKNYEWTPWSFHREIDKLFDDAFKSFSNLNIWGSNAEKAIAESVIKPKVDIVGTEKEYTVTAELPGIEEKNIEIELQDEDMLVIKAHREKEEESKDEKKGFYRIERSCGSFERVLRLPEDADTAGIKASYENGVLSVAVPRIQGTQSSSKKIELQKKL